MLTSKKRKNERAKQMLDQAKLTFPADYTLTYGKAAEMLTVLVSDVADFADAPELPPTAHIAEARLTATGETVDGEPVMQFIMTIYAGKAKAA